ncbi:MAG: hypothetical protein WBC22_06730 [Sedimentisphaerales bacterium]
MRTVTSKLLVVCVVLGLLAVIPGFVQTADAARWSFHFSYPDCPGGDLEVWATRDCVRQLLLFGGYTKNCRKYVGHVPGAPYNDLIFDFYWDFWCGNHDHIKIALPGWNGSNWELKELPPWIDAQVTGGIPPIISVGDPTGNIQRVYIVVDPEVWRNNYSGVVLDEYDIQNGTHPDLPGYLIGTTPITFDPLGPASGPFSTTPLNGILSRDGEIELIPEPPQPPGPVFEQLDWVGPFDPVTNSSWGRVTLQINKPRGFYYLNLSVDTDGNQQFTPVIRNMSVETTGETQTIASFFDIFLDEQNYEPHPVPALSYKYSISEVPQQEPPTAEPMTADVISIEYQVGSEDVIVGPLPDLVNPGILCLVKKSGKLPNLGSFVNQPQSRNYCAPGAISNSLKYLQATGGIDSTVDTSINTVAGQIGTTSSGTSSNWYLKKQTLSYFTDIVTTRYIEAPLDDAEIDDLINELNRGQDIEMDLKGHVEVLAGLRVRCDGSIELDLFDDNQTDSVSDPMHTSTISGTYPNTQYVDGMELERFVIECPIEEEIVVLLPFLFLDTLNDWLNALENGLVRALTLEEGEGYLWQWNPDNPEVELEGNTYPQDQYFESDLFVYEGGGEGGLEPNDAGLVMAWGNSDGNSTSAWAVKYDKDPDLTNCLITLVVTAPQWAMTSPGSQINKVSFGLGNPPAGTGPVRSWSWDCGPGKTIPWNTPTILKIDTSKTGLTAATPKANGYTNNIGFNLTTVTWLCVDENGTWIGPPNPAPGPGGFQFLWNYWHWILVSPKTTVDKGIYKKWSQPPVVLDPNHDPPMILGWDEHSTYWYEDATGAGHPLVVADDWACKDNRPVTDIHWWGSFHNWTQPKPPALPTVFHIGIWTNVPVDPDDPDSFSHPGELVWENYCDNYVWNFAGYDKDPRNNINFPGEPGFDEPVDACFQFTQLLSQDEWFYQEPSDDPDNPRIYWLSISPRWGSDDHPDWGWKTRPWYFEDDAVIIQQADPWPPVVGTTKWINGIPIQYPPYPDPEGVSWDVAFELTTNEPAYEDNPIPGDANLDGVIDFKDVAITAANWLEKAPGF